MFGEAPIIKDNVSDFSDEDQEPKVYKSGELSNQSQFTSSSYFKTINSQLSKDKQFSNPYQNRGSGSMNVSYDLYEGMAFKSKQEIVNAIKIFHFLHSFNYDVEENKSDKYVVKCTQYGNGCQWRVKASFSKIRRRWEIMKINGIHTCTTSLISQDHVRLCSFEIAHNIVDLVKENLGIPIKTLMVDILQRFGYTMAYKNAWTAKQKAHEIAFGAFKPCIEGFQYCKPILEVDDTFLQENIMVLYSLSLQKMVNISPLTFTIVESESKEDWIWFLDYFRRYVTPQPNLCIILDRGTSLLVSLQSEQVG
ncbi:hypothetical protein HKD37_19G053460 [Glycine soja]